MEGRRELRIEDFETCLNSSKSIAKMLTPTFSLDFSYRFSRKHFNEPGQVSKQIFLQFKTSLNSLRHSISELRSKQNEQKHNGLTL